MSAATEKQIHETFGVKDDDSASNRFRSSTNAYMLMYRKVADKARGETNVKIPDHGAVPAYIQEMVSKMEKETERKKKEEEEAKTVVPGPTAHEQP